MFLSRKYTITASVAIILGLTACGQNYTPQKYTGFPYNNTRTAGSGIEYVLANLAPPKGIEPKMMKEVEEVEEIEEVESPEVKMENEAPLIPSTRAEKIFKEFQSKTKTYKLEILRQPLLPKNYPGYND